jgi:hypothetical protein
MVALDGNAIAGDLHEVFGVDSQGTYQGVSRTRPRA